MAYRWALAWLLRACGATTSDAARSSGRRAEPQPVDATEPGHYHWLICAGVIAVAVAGKLGGSMLAARVTGMSWSDSFALGALMNTRGLIELIVLGLGYDLGILSPEIFAMMVLMALVTTLMTGPLLQVWAALRRRGEAAAKADAAA